jgi:protein DGCR14
MPPPPPPKKIKRPKQVLSEEVYQAGVRYHISKMLGRDEAEAQYAYLAALESKDEEAIEEAGRNLIQAMTPRTEARQTRPGASSATPLKATAGETPHAWVGATPVAKSDTAAPSLAPEEQKIDLKANLTEFQATYTSEDSEAAYQSMDKSNMKRREEAPWLYNGSNQLPSKRQLAILSYEEKMKEAAKNPARAMELATKAPRDRRPAGAEFKPSAPLNALMHYPESIEDEFETWQQFAERTSKMPPKEIIYHNTRLQPPELPGNNVVPPSPAISAIDAAIAGRPRATSTDDGFSGAETPNVRGYKYVDIEPTDAEKAVFSPGAIDHEALQKMIRERLGGPTPFKISTETERERLGNKAAGRVVASKTSRVDELRGDVTGKTPAPKFSSAAGLTPGRRAVEMTPAQQKLLSLATPKRKENWDFIKEDGASVKSLLGVTPIRK